jgi:hypothetical protein
VKSVGDVLASKQNLRKSMETEKVKGFSEVLAAHETAEGISHL